MEAYDEPRTELGLRGGGGTEVSGTGVCDTVLDRPREKMNGREGRDEEVADEEEEEDVVACDCALGLFQKNLPEKSAAKMYSPEIRGYRQAIQRKLVSANCRFNAGSCSRRGFGRRRLAKAFHKSVPAGFTFTPFRDERAGIIFLYYAFRYVIFCLPGSQGVKPHRRAKETHPRFQLFIFGLRRLKGGTPF